MGNACLILTGDCLHLQYSVILWTLCGICKIVYVHHMKNSRYQNVQHLLTITSQIGSVALGPGTDESPGANSVYFELIFASTSVFHAFCL